MSRYKPYPKYKESGVEWLGEVPEHWEKYRIDWITTIIRGNTGFKKDELLNKGDFVALQYGKTYKVDEINDSFNFYVNSEFFKSNQVVHQGDTILVSTSETIEDLGHSCFYNRKELGLIGGEQILLKPYNKLLFGKYLYYYSRVFCNELRKYATGLKVFRFSTDDLKNIFVSSPPLEEQTTIANFLDRETAKIDMLIAKQERLIELLQEKRQALISHAVTKGLDPNAKMKESGVAWLGEVPEHWEVIKLGYLTSKIGSGKTPKGGAEVYSDTGILFLRSQNVYDDGLHLEDVVKISETIHAEMENTHIKGGDILLNVTGGSIGRSCLVPDDLERANVNQHVCIIRLIKRGYQAYISFAMKSSAIKAQIDAVQNGAAREGLNFEQISGFKIAIAPLQEQNLIIDYINDKTAKIDTLIEKAQQSIKLLKERRTALISAAVTGKIDVREVAV